MQVFNQRPVAVFSRPSDGTIDTQYTFISESFDPDGDTIVAQLGPVVGNYVGPGTLGLAMIKAKPS